MDTDYEVDFDDLTDNDYPHADGFGGYRCQTDEYVRPPRPLVLPAGDPEHESSGNEVYGESLRRRLDSRQVEVEVELVPEPLNVFDRYALCLDVDGIKVGYMGARFAEYWHPVVRAFNTNCFRVLVPSEVHDGNDDFPWLNLLMPDWREWTAIARRTPATSPDSPRSGSSFPTTFELGSSTTSTTRKAPSCNRSKHFHT